ncbi:hypothetical protein Q3G72_022143 [Acer saccharum]|nr:hypothetical protein Q3G72_022143 [Acer saccharum]
MLKTRLLDGQEQKRGKSLDGEAKEKASDDGYETDIGGNRISELEVAAVQKGGSESSATAAPRMETEKPLEDRRWKGMTGDVILENMCVDGPSNGPDGKVGRAAQLEIDMANVGHLEESDPPKTGPISSQDGSNRDSHTHQTETQLLVQTKLKEKGRKWKRAAREAQRKTKTGYLVSPLHRKMAGGFTSLKSPIRKNGSSSQTGSPTTTNSGKGKGKREEHSQPSPRYSGSPTAISPDRRSQGTCKRKVIFDLPEGTRGPKRGKSSEDGIPNFISNIAAEPVEQARREQ